MSRRSAAKPLIENWKRTRGSCVGNARFFYLVRMHFKHMQCRVLIHIPGSGESGKSTIVKQMKIIHQNGYTQEERALYRLTIYKNLIDCMKAVIGAMRQFEIEPESSNVKDYTDYIMEYNVDPDPDTPLDPKVAEAVSAVWADPSIPKVMERQSEFYLMDSAP